MSYSILVVCEGDTDFAWVTKLADRSILAFGPQWVRDDLDAAREYRGEDPAPADGSHRFVRWDDLDGLSRRYHHSPNRWLQLRIADFGGALPDHDDVYRFHRFYEVLKVSTALGDPHAVLLLRDADSDDQRRTDLIRLAELYRDGPIPVVIGVPHPETECWLLAGFLHDATDAERQSVHDYKRDTGVDPCHDSERLNHDNEGHPRNAKCALRTLCPSEERKMRCLDAPFDTLRHHGQRNGLAAFLNELQTRFVPALFGGAVPSAR